MLDVVRFYKVSMIYCQFEMLVLVHLTKRLVTWAEAASAVEGNGTLEAGGGPAAQFSTRPNDDEI